MTKRKRTNKIFCLCWTIPIDEFMIYPRRHTTPF